ncbi:glycosyltransferase [Marinimicrobium sp. C2-29]|uniref:glycosyltransferase n=1 Tax=Marinimicrobium sp. C2-29 TaxID=3139825 RepID=UPI0031392F42
MKRFGWNRLKTVYWRWRLRHAPVPQGFDPEAYRALYRDVAASGVDPLVHYLRFGRPEGRDPNPDFSVSGYCLVCPEAREAQDPVGHYQAIGRKAGFLPRPELEGGQTFLADRPTLMVVGHQAGLQLYGAERSLLDILAAFQTLGVNLVVTLPSAANPDYVAQVRALAWRLVILPYGWWRQGHPPLDATQAHFESLLQRYRVDGLYANTMVLDEPLLAARARGIPVAVHIRELPAHDRALCETLGAGPADIVARLKALVTLALTNSRFTANSLGLDRVLVVPNSIDPAGYQNLGTPSERGEPLTVGMVSSNLPKKGLYDFVLLAEGLKSVAPGLKCRLIGPENCYVEALRRRKNRGRVPANLDFSDYTDNPQSALEQLDILLNLSHFEESFGRSVLEAMAAGRPVVAYEWGALPELVEHGVSGYLAPLGQVEQVVEHVMALVGDRSLRLQMGQAGQRRAEESFGPKATQDALRQFLHLLLKSEKY